jgi:uncharacterized protein (TIGR03492 family)
VARHPRRLLALSNGQAEDELGARLAPRVAAALGASLAALPLVGEGGAYEAVGAEVLGPRRRLPSEGQTLHHPLLLWRDLRSGLLRVTASQALAAAGARGDAVIVVGDVYAQLVATLVRAPRVVYQPLVSIRQAEGGGSVPLHRTFMERIRAPERTLMRRAALRVYTRDEATAAWLRARGVAHACFLGNPMMDDLGGRSLTTRAARPVVALLPGRRAYAVASLSRMLLAIERVPESLALVAWVGDVPPVAAGWSADGPGAPPVVERWRRGAGEVWWVRGAFADVLASADAVLGTSGTAQEQAAGLGLPVVSFPLPPWYTSEFLANQGRLLGGALRIVPGEPEALAAALREALADGPHARAARRDGPARMGPPGGAERIAADAAHTLATRLGGRLGPLRRGA